MDCVALDFLSAGSSHYHRREALRDELRGAGFPVEGIVRTSLSLSSQAQLLMV
jgi:hypothetical protein